MADARAIIVPTQLLISGADWVVHHGPQHRFFERLGTPIKERHVLPGFFHDTLGEKDRAVAVQKARDFILARFAEPPGAPSLLDADRIGYTRDEADRLASPLPPLSPRGLYWAMVRANMRLGGMLSEGIALGHRTGFDSGSTLDYVYRNQPRGAGPLGRLIDRNYLELDRLARHPPAQAACRGAAAASRCGRWPTRACRCGWSTSPPATAATCSTRWRRSGITPDSILLRDYSDLNVAAGTRS